MHSPFFASMKLVVALSVATLLFSSQASAYHPFHIGLFEAEWNPKTGRLEMAVRVHPIDLQQALKQFRGKKIDLDKDPEIDTHLLEYFEKHLELRPKASVSSETVGEKAEKPAKAKIHWVGKEIDIKWAWVYFELEVPTDQPLKMMNNVLLEIVPDQSNTVIVTSGTVRKTVAFRKATTLKDFPRPAELTEESTTEESPK